MTAAEIENSLHSLSNNRVLGAAIIIFNLVLVVAVIVVLLYIFGVINSQRDMFDKAEIVKIMKWLVLLFHRYAPS